MGMVHLRKVAGLDTTTWVYLYTKTLRSLSRKHPLDEKDEVIRATGFLRQLDREAFVAGRGPIWIPKPDPMTGYYPVMEDLPFNQIRRAIRKNTGDRERARAWGAVAESTRPFRPLFAREPGLDRGQRERLLSHILVSFPFVKGRTPALLGKRVPGELRMTDVGTTKSVKPIRGIDPGNWARGFGPLKFAAQDEKKAAVKRVLQVNAATALLGSGYLSMRDPDILRAGTKTLGTLTSRAEHREKARGLLGWAKSRRIKLSRSRHGMMRAAAKRARMKYPMNRRMALGSALPAIGMPVGLALLHKSLRSKKTKHALEPYDVKCYAAGWMWQLKQMGKGLKRVAAGAIPAATGGALGGALGAIHTEIGLPPTTVGLQPVQRRSLRKEYTPFTNIELRQIAVGLQQRASTVTDESTRNAFQKEAARIAVELTERTL